jgi:hypothetical protein
MSRRKRIAAAGWLCAAAVGLIGGPPSAAGSGPAWNVLLRIESGGDYRLEGPTARTDGTYSLEFVWTGTIEKDDEDFLLVHTACVLKSWRIEERNTDGDIFRMLTERDTPDKPELKMNYALNDEGRVRFDFTIAGFDVPLAGSTESFPLVFPLSAESGSKTGTVAYNAAVKSGSNDIAVDTAKIMRGPAEETFAWTWRRQAWIQLSDSLVFQANGHSARVTLAITPK